MRISSPLAALSVLAASVLVLSIVDAWSADENVAQTPRFEPALCPTGRLPSPIPALDDARCGFLVVPENRSLANGKTIRLAVAIVPAVAAEPASDPIVHLTGGPGGVAMLDAQPLVNAGFNRRRELILMNQRGTFLSEPALTCASIDDFNRRLVGLPLDDEATRKKHVAATRRCRRELVARGIDIAA